MLILGFPGEGSKSWRIKKVVLNSSDVSEKLIKYYEWSKHESRDFA
jgi:hypothetical protein